MKILKLKEEGIRVSIKDAKLGVITFDSEINNPSEYRFFFDNGFAYLFTEVELKPLKYKAISQEKFKICEVCNKLTCICNQKTDNNGNI